MTQIFLVRHGQSEGNLFRRVQGQSDLDLTAAGRAQLPYLQKRFADEPLAAVYTSPLRRTRETAAAIAGEKNIPVIVEPRLIEMSFGTWEMRPWGEVSRESPELKNAFLNDPDNWHMEGAEEHPAVQERVFAAMRDIAAAHDGSSVAVACHGMAIRAFLARVLGVESAHISDRVPIVSNTSVSKLRWENGTFTIEYINDTSHLPEAPYAPFRSTKGTAGERSYDLCYRPLDPETKADFYLDCYRDAWTCAHGSLQGFDSDACLFSAEYHAAENRGSVTEAVLDDESAGILVLDDRRDSRKGIGWISFLYVMPSLRGHHCGIQLVGTAVLHFRALGRRTVRLTVAPENPAVGFYEKAGFRRVGTERGAVGSLLVMEWTL